MKKLFCLILIFTLIISVAVCPVSAQEKTIYKDIFIEKYDLKDVSEDEYIYREIAELDVDCDDAMDFLLIYAEFPVACCALGGLDLGDRFIIQPYLYGPFTYRYALYDFEKFEFIPFSKTILNDYPFLPQYLESYNIGTPYGDVDADGKLSIMDATYIQLVCAQLAQFPEDDDISYYDMSLTYVSDINKDGERDILDATAIQQKLASV